MLCLDYRLLQYGVSAVKTSWENVIHLRFASVSRQQRHKLWLWWLREKENKAEEVAGGKKWLSQAEWLGILSPGVSMGGLQCVLIHPSQRALKQGFPKPANKSLPQLNWYSVAASLVFMLLNEQWNNKQIQVIGALHLLRV